MKEQFKQHPERKDIRVSNMGYVEHESRMYGWRRLSPHIGTGGMRYISHNKTMINVAKLVLSLFCKPEPKVYDKKFKWRPLFINGNKGDCSIGNLRWEEYTPLAYDYERVRKIHRPNAFTKKTGVKIQLLRKAGLSREKVSELCRCNPEQIWKLETGQYNKKWNPKGI